MGYREQVIADGATNYWRLSDGGASAIDAIGGATGTISGGVTLGQPGALADGNKAVTLDGATGKILCGSVAVPAAFSVECWVKKSTPSQTAFFSNRPVAFQGVYLAVTSVVVIYMPASSNPVITALRTVMDGTWHYVVVACDGVTTWVYVDGTLDTTAAQNHVGLTGPCALGHDPLVPDFWPGGLDEIAVYPTALSAAKIAAHYAASALPATGGGAMVPWWWNQLGEDDMQPSNVWDPITPSDAVDLKRGLTYALWVGALGDVAAVMQNGFVQVFPAVPAGSLLPLAVRRINATGTTATGLVALYRG